MKTKIQGRVSGEPSVSRVLIVDDHPLVREGLTRLIEGSPDLSVCGEAEEKSETFRRIEADKPDLVLLDLSLKRAGGLSMVRDLILRFPQVPVLVLSMHDESIYAERVLRAGARGYVMKDQASAVIVSAIQRVLAGDIFLSPRMATKLLGRMAKGVSKLRSNDELDVLGDRELEVFRLIGEGLSNRKIAAQLHLSIKTVESHREHIKTKLGLESGRDLVRQAVLWASRETRA